MTALQIGKRELLTLIILIGVVGVCVVLGYLYHRHQLKNETGSQAATLLSESVATPYTTLTGEPFSFAPYKGKVRVVTLWASWSPQSATDLAVLETTAQHYSEAGVAVIAVNRKEPRDRARAYLATLPQYQNITYVIDETDAFYASVGGYAMPETIIFDAKGTKVWHFRGVLTPERLSEQLDLILTNDE